MAHEQIITRDEAMQKGFLTVDEFSCLFNMSKISVYRHISSGSIEAVTLLGSRRKYIPYRFYSKWIQQSDDDSSICKEKKEGSHVSSCSLMTL